LLKPFISKVDGARKVKSSAHVAMNKNSDPIYAEMLFMGLAGRTVPLTHLLKLLELSETSRARKLILGLQVNIDKANSRRYDVTR